MAAAAADAPVAAAGFVPVSAARYRLELPLRFATVPAARAHGLRLLEAAGGGALTFDLSALSAVDSAGLALLVDWLACARARGCTLRYEKVPQSLQGLAKMSDVESLLGLGGEDAAVPPTPPPS